MQDWCTNLHRHDNGGSSSSTPVRLPPFVQRAELSLVEFMTRAPNRRRRAFRLVGAKGETMSGKGYFTTFAKLLAIASLCCAAAAAPAAAAPTKVTKCKGQLAAGSYDSVVVPQNATCSLSGANVAGNVTMERRATLNGGSVTIGGSLIAQGATNVRLFDFSVGGDVRIVGGGGDLVIQSSTVHGVIDISGVNGFIAIIDNASPHALGRLRVVNNAVRASDPTSTVGINISSNQVLTDAEVSGNTGAVDKNVQGNTVGGRLSCIGNAPPFDGRFNTAAAFQGQCTGFV